MQHDTFDTFDTFDGHRTTTGYDDNALPTTQVASLSRLSHDADDRHGAHADDGMERDRSAAALFEREERLFRTTFDRAPIGIAHVAHDGRWLRCNQRLSDLLGYSLEELSQLSIQDFTHPDDLDAELDYIRRALAGELDAYELQKRFVRKDGALVWTHLTVSLVRTPEGEPEYFIVMVQDITERKCLEEDRAHLYAAEQDTRRQAEERAERLHAILETMADGVAVYDAAGRPVQVVNRAYRELFALERAPTEYETTTTMDRARLVQVRDAATGAHLPFEETPVGRALRGEVVTGSSADIRARAFDGRELELNTSAAALREPDGRVAGVVLVLRDLTERNRLAREREAALTHAALQAEELDRIFEAAADGLIVYDPEGRIVRENPAARRILGLDAAPPGFRQLPESERFARYALRDEEDRPVPPEESSIMRARRAHVGTGSGGRAEPEASEVRMRALDGREIELNSAAAPLWDREGRLAGTVSVLHDLTERNRLARERAAAQSDELAAREASRRMEEFLAVAAHDLRSPLTATLGYIALAERQTGRLAATAESSEFLRQVVDVRQRLEDAKQGAHRLSRLLTLLFDTAVIRAGKLELHYAPGDLAALVGEHVAELHVAAPERTIRLHTPDDGEPIQVEADADRIGQVITNYVTNALKYSPSDRPVDVSVEAHGNRARVAVCDQGPGIPKEEQRRVWELFHRAPEIEAQGGTAGGTQGGSLGLGLYICKAIVEAHGGRVGITSAVGRGSTFWFTLPVADPPSSPAGTPA